MNQNCQFPNRISRMKFLTLEVWPLNYSNMLSYGGMVQKDEDTRIALDIPKI